jgi:catechol 2,3-dioxygenase-like lactoylglutathione lyase family enzyme
MFELEGIDHVALSVRDVERSAQWYIEILGFERRHQGMWSGVPTFIGKGTTAIALFPARTFAYSLRIIVIRGNAWKPQKRIEVFKMTGAHLTL